jgi:hypothetical protein
MVDRHSSKACGGEYIFKVEYIFVFLSSTPFHPHPPYFLGLFGPFWIVWVMIVW